MRARLGIARLLAVSLLMGSSQAMANKDKPYLSVQGELGTFVLPSGDAPLGLGACLYLGDGLGLEGAYLTTEKTKRLSGRVRVFPKDGSFNLSLFGDQVERDLTAGGDVSSGHETTGKIKQIYAGLALGNRWTPGMMVIGVDWFGIANRLKWSQEETTTGTTANQTASSTSNSKVEVLLLRVVLGIGF